MPTGPLACVVRQVRRTALGGLHAGRGDAELVDAELLERFVAHHDERAFELLVRRHGPMVLGVCQRVLRNDADAEDAFQATFIVLVRKAATIVPRAKVGNWLYGVAHKTALKAKAMHTTRRIKERETGTASGQRAARALPTSLLEALDAELSVLPEKYRTPIVLCDLEGLSYKDAAAQLGCVPGTLAGRLSRGRSLLARRLSGRLARHGQSLTAAALAGLLAQNATASVSPSLLALSTRIGCLLASGQRLSVHLASARVVSLAEGVMKMMLLSKLKTVTGVFLFALVAALAGWIYTAQLSAQTATPGATPAHLIDDDAQAPATQSEAAKGPPHVIEAEFILRAADRQQKAVAVVVAGTEAPVLSIPVRDDARVLLNGRRVRINDLPSGTRICLQMDTTNSAIQEIRAIQNVAPAAAAQNVKVVAQIEPPSVAEVLRALPKVPSGVPFVCDVWRDDVVVTIERLVDQVDPPRFFPLVGKARLHHRHWKCTVRYTETIESSYPVPFSSKRPRVEVVYIDTDYLVQSK